MSKSYGTVTVRKLRTGDNTNISFSIDKGLVIFYKKDSTASQVTTDWSGQNAPTITPSVTSQRGHQLVLSNHTWKVDGTTLLFTGETSGGWTTDSTGKFQMNADGALKCINANLFTAGNFHNVLLAYSVDVTPLGSTAATTISKTAEIEVLDQGSNAYWGGITTEGSTALSADNTSARLSAVLYYQGGQQTAGTYTVKWHINNTEVTALTPNVTLVETDKQHTLTVTRDAVDGMAHVVAKFFVGGKEVEGAGITLRDDSDAIQVVVPDEVTVEEYGTLEIAPRLYHQSQKQYITQGIKWEVQVHNNYTLDVVYDSTDKAAFPSIPTGMTFDPDTGQFTMTEASMYYDQDGTSLEYFPTITFGAEV